jgi:hypothetical protein
VQELVRHRATIALLRERDVAKKSFLCEDLGVDNLTGAIESQQSQLAKTASDIVDAHRRAADAPGEVPFADYLTAAIQQFRLGEVAENADLFTQATLDDQAAATLDELA